MLVFVALLGTYLETWMVGLRIPVQLLYGLPLMAWAALRLRGPRDLLDVAVAIGLGALAVAAAAGVDHSAASRPPAWPSGTRSSSG